MARRKGWDELSDNYRKRLARGSIDLAAYESGASLGAARGHKTPGGVSEKIYSGLRKLARGLTWDRGEKPDEMVDEALRAGRSPEWIRERLAEREADTDAYRKRHDKDTGHKHWERRKVYVPPSWYWYH